MKRGSYESNTYEEKVLLDAVTATATSGEVVIAGAQKITFLFTRAAHSAGSSLFEVEVTLDDVTWVTAQKLITHVENTNAQNLTRVNDVTLAANGTSLVSLDLSHDAFYAMRVKVTETTDGTHSAKAFIER